MDQETLEKSPQAKWYKYPAWWALLISIAALTFGVYNRFFPPRPTVTNVGWKVGFWKKRHAIQLVKKDAYSSGIPVTINDGEEAKWLIPLDLEDNWAKRFARDFLMPRPRFNLFWTRLQVYTSVGKRFETQIEKSLKEKLLEECKKLEA